MSTKKAGDITFDGTQIFLVMSDCIVRIKGYSEAVGGVEWVDKGSRFMKGNTSLSNNNIDGASDRVLFNIFDVLRKALDD
jgi:hypothetical protein